MNSYSYRESTKENIKYWVEDWMENDQINLDEVSMDSMEDYLNTVLWTEDSVTGNASGSFTFCRYTARENFFRDEDSEDYLSEMIGCGMISEEELGIAVRESNWEMIDVWIRCYLLSECIAEVVRELYDI